MMTAPLALTGFLSTVGAGWLLLGVLVTALTLGFVAAPLGAWTAAGAVLVVGLLSWPWLLAYAAVMTVLNVPALRRVLVSGPIMAIMKALKFLPVISETERTALTAGTVWIDGELFSGDPDWKKLLGEPYVPTEVERTQLRTIRLTSNSHTYSWNTFSWARMMVKCSPF